MQFSKKNDQISQVKWKKVKLEIPNFLDAILCREERLPAKQKLPWDMSIKTVNESF